MGLLVEGWSAERIAREEDTLFIGFDIADTETAASEAPAPDPWGMSLPTAATAGETGPVPAAPEEMFSAEDTSNPTSPHQGTAGPSGPDDLPGLTWTFEER
ncbi:hypothetical protein [Rhodovulum steppense]|uniref:Uncharacterized protein n=1 Tax=Rhodovulum steppense TaxID=540251 RepID=A0A4R1Z4K0_9RHOB|nr:hypothetical protein EV216_101230 [Rhodovulum steppense]